MANAVFNSLESYFSGNKLKPKLDWAKFDMSNIRTMDCDMGILYPFYLEDCLPGDKIKIRNTVKAQALPLKNPIFNNFKLYTYYYYVPYYLLWHKFDRFIEGGRDGTYTVELPYVQAPEIGYRAVGEVEELNYKNEIFGSNTLYDYMGFEPIRTIKEAEIKWEQNKINAFPFAAYQRIWRDYFINQDVQTETNVNRWFPEDDFDFQLTDGECFVMGQDTTEDATIIANKDYGDITEQGDEQSKKPYLMALRPRNWNKDYFTSMWFSPQRGTTQAVPIGASLNFNNAVAENGTTITGTDVGHINVGGANETGLKNLLFGNDSGTTGYKNPIVGALNKGTINGGFTLADLHLAQQIEIWMIRNMSVKAQYNEFLRIHFDDAPLDERLTKPAYIGGTVQDIQISEVLQASQTTKTSAQGTATGHATSYENEYVGTYHSHEYGLIMGICCIMPEAYYETGIDRHWTKTNRYDYYFPEFADLEPQAVLRKEIQAAIKWTGVDFKWGEKPIGYIGRYDEYRHHKNLAVGAMRDPKKTDFTSWVIKRDDFIAGELAGLNQNLISTDKRKTIWKSPAIRYIYNSQTEEIEEFYTSNINHDAWATGKTMNPFIVQIGIGCEMVRALPYVNDPTRQGR